MTEQLICVSSTEHDIEVWGTVEEVESGYGIRAQIDRCIDALKGEADRMGLTLHAVHLETWPQVLEDYRRRFGWAEEVA